MLFVKKFCSNRKYYNITHDILDLAFKGVFLFKMNIAEILPIQSQKLKQSVIHVHIDNKTPERRH